jgi:hypothetical protein
MIEPYARASAGSKPAASPIVIGSEVTGGLGTPPPIPTPTGPLVIGKRGMTNSSMPSTWRYTWIWAASESMSAPDSLACATSA